MPKFQFLLSAILLCGWLFAHASAYSASGPQARLSPAEIMQKVEDFDDGDNMIGDIELVLTDRNGHQQVRKMRRFAKNFGSDQRNEYTYSYFYSPSVIKGTTVLTYDYDNHDKDDDTWIFIPDIGKIKRLTSKDKTSKLMGSDINYGDLTQRDINQYSFTLLGEEKVRDWNTWLIEFVPKTEEETKRFGYLKGQVWVDKESFRAVRSIFWKTESSQVKYFEIYKMEKIDGIWTALDMSFTVKKGDVVIHRTDMRVNNPRYNQDVPESLFVPEGLDKPLPARLLPSGAVANDETVKQNGLGALRVKAILTDDRLFGIPKILIVPLVGLILLATVTPLVIRRRRRAAAVA